MTHPVPIRFLPNDLIRLVAASGDHAAGARGHIVGHFAREEPVWLISLDGDSACIAVRSDEIVLNAA